MKDSQELDQTYALWHYRNCELEYENDGDDSGARWCEAYCIDHSVNVTECLPEYDWENTGEFEEAREATI